jgi:hypothetical protein
MRIGVNAGNALMSGISTCLAGLLLTVATATGGTQVDRRSHELVRRECRAVIDTEDVTLFANGTVRLISKHDEERSVQLTELTPDEVQAFLRRIREVDLSEEDPVGVTLQGDWVEQCELYLDVFKDEEPTRYRFGRYDSLSLPLSRVNRVADDLLETVKDRAPTTGLPYGYVPKPGDVLERVDGVLFEVIGLTGDKKGLELIGVEQPLTIYVLNEAIGQQFKALVKRRKFP